MKKNKDKILDYIYEKTLNDENVSFTTLELAEIFHLARANVSTSLNQLVKENILQKSDGRPTRYFLNQKDAFSQLVGANGSLKNAIRLAKAFLMYPENVLTFFINGEHGSGKEEFAHAMYEYAKANHVITEDAPLEILDVSQYDSDNDIFDVLWRNEYQSDRFLLVKHIENMSLSLQRRFQQMDAFNVNGHKVIVVCSEEITSNKTSRMFDSEYPFHAKLSSLTDRPLKERMEFIESFFQKESTHVKKDIVINSELLRCLLLYQCPQNIKQLKNDIKIACANAFVRQTGSDLDKLYVFLSDCHPYVRKGFLRYRDSREEIESLIPDNYTYSYSASEVKRTDERKDHNESIYQYIDDKVQALKKRRISDEDIQTIISDDVEKELSLLVDQMNQDEYDLTALEKIMDPEIIHSVEEFLKKAAVRFDRVYSLSIFQALCIQVNGALKETERSDFISKKKITEIISQYPDEYAYTSRFVSALEKKFGAHLSIDDTVLMTLALCHDHNEMIHQDVPHILVIMHGTVASSIAKAVNTLYDDANVYSYDLLLDSDLNQAYEEIKNYCLKIANAKGLLVFYDMGSIRRIMEMISQETGIVMQMIEMPMTLLVLASAFQFTSGNTLRDTYEYLIDHGFGSFDTLKNEIGRKDIVHQKYIIALCMSGSGAAIQIKQYLEKNVDLGDTKVIPLALNDHNTMMDAINYYAENGEIQCIVGTYDPKVYNVPYISIAQLFNTPADKLDLLLAVNYNDPTENINYRELYDYLDEQLESVDIHKIKRTIHKTIRQMKRKIRDIDSGEEVGLFVHIACAIDRIKANTEPYINASRDQIILKHKKMYHDLKDILEDLEIDAEVVFGDDEIATIIEILL